MESNKTPLIFNVVLSIAVIILFVLQFTDNSKEELNNDKQDELTVVDQSEVIKKDSKLNPINTSAENVAFVNLDSLMNNYTVFKDKSNEVEREQKVFIKKQQNYQAKLMQLQQEIEQKAQGGVYQTQAEYELDLQKAQNEALNMDKTLREEEERIYKKSTKIQEELVSELKTFVEKYCNENNLDYVITTGTTSAVIYFNPSMDITNLVIEGLNNQKK